MRTSIAVILGAALLLAPVAHAGTSGHPDSAVVVTVDIDHFWEAFDAAAPDFAPEPFQSLYVDRGTIGLEGFMKGRIASADNIATVVRNHPRFYASTRESMAAIPEMIPAIRAAFYALEYLYPDAIFPDVYFVVGAMNSGGTISSKALIIGAEMYGRTPDWPVDELGEWHRQVIKGVDAAATIVAHELIHYQQRYPDAEPTLLSQSIKEGSADFIAERIAGRHINAHVHEWADPRERELWEEFRARLHDGDFDGWLYSSSPDRPNDLGYWMGYRICAAYTERVGDIQRAIADILTIDDFDAFLEASGYAQRFE